MNRALMNQNTLPFVNPPSGPLANAPVASAGNQNMFYMSTDFGLCKYVSVFNNAGMDGVDCGHPSWIDLLLPSSAYTIDLVASLENEAWTCAISIGKYGSDQLAMVNVMGVSTMLYRCGNAETNAVSYSPNVMGRFSLSSTGTTHKLTTPSASSASASNGPITSTNSLTIGSRSPAGDVPMNGAYAKVVVKDGAGVIVDVLDMNKWDGSSTMRFDSGHACTVSNGTPFTAKSYACIPWNLLL